MWVKMLYKPFACFTNFVLELVPKWSMESGFKVRRKKKRWMKAKTGWDIGVKRNDTSLKIPRVNQDHRLQNVKEGRSIDQ